MQAEASQSKDVPKGFVRFYCRRCDNWLDIKESLLPLVKRLYKGWKCNICGAHNEF